MAKKQKTFADRAKKIMKKYEARPDDTAAQDSKNRELGVLRQEQEMFKQNKAMEAMETLSSMGYGDMMQGQPQQEQQTEFAGGGPMINPMEMNSLVDQFKASQAQTGEDFTQSEQGGFQSDAANPYVQAGQLGADAYGLSQNLRKQDPYSSQKYATDFRTDTTAQEGAIDSSVASGSLMGMEQDRQYSQMGNKAGRIARGAMLADKAGQAKAGIISQAQERDRGINAGAEANNIGLANQDAQINMQAEGARRTNIEQYLRNIGQTTVPGFEQDKNKANTQDAIINLLGDKYGYTGSLEDLDLMFKGK